MESNNGNNNRPYLKSVDVLKKGALLNGYTENFVYGDRGVISASNSTVYDLNQVKVVSMITFQGDDNPAEHAELYIIETPDGRKGTFEKKIGGAR